METGTFMENTNYVELIRVSTNTMRQSLSPRFSEKSKPGFYRTLWREHYKDFHGRNVRNVC